MKIFVRDDNDRKISKWHIANWEAQGHEVIQNMYPDWEQVAWSDVAIFFWCDQYAQQLATEPNLDHVKKIIQCVDIDGWSGHWGTVEWKNIDHLIFMSEHIRDMVMGHLNGQYEDKFPTPITHLPLGIDVTQWKYRDRTNNHKKVMGFVADEWWSAKNPAMVVQAMAALVKQDPAWQFQWVGKWGPEKWLKYYIENQIKQLGLSEHVAIDWNRQESLDDWWESIDYFTTFSQKDSFSLIVGEAMAKGIKTLVHNFYGADKIWNEKYIWKTLDELVEKVTKDDYDSEEYREYIIKNHDINPILERWDQTITSVMEAK